MSIIRFRSPECVMVRIPKTGSTSIVKGILEGMQNAACTSFGVFPEEWRSLYSFAFVRNPFDRLVSAFLMFRGYFVATDAEKKFRDKLSLGRIMDVVEDPKVSPIGDGFFSKLKLHCLPMTAPFFHLSQVTDIYRFEEFNSECRRLTHRLGLVCLEVPHWRKSIREPYQNYFTPQDRERAESLFKADLQEFSYSFQARCTFSSHPLVRFLCGRKASHQG
jgi:hypothetical protein